MEMVMTMQQNTSSRSSRSCCFLKSWRDNLQRVSPRRSCRKWGEVGVPLCKIYVKYEPTKESVEKTLAGIIIIITIGIVVVSNQNWTKMGGLKPIFLLGLFRASMVLALRDKVPCIETDKFYRNPNRYAIIQLLRYFIFRTCELISKMFLFQRCGSRMVNDRMFKVLLLRRRRSLQLRMLYGIDLWHQQTDLWLQNQCQ